MADTITTNSLNYLGVLYQIGADQTPFLNMIGGLSGGKVSNSRTFPVAQPWALNSAAQPAITENTSMTAPTAVTYARGQDTNVCQIFHKAVRVSYAKQAAIGELSGLSIEGTNNVRNEHDFQVAGSMKQMAKDFDYTCLNGVYQAPADADTAAKTRGIITATATNAVAAGSASLAKSHVQSLIRTMAGNGAQFDNMVLFCNAFQKQSLTDLYAYAPEDRNVGGVNIKQIETDFCMLGVVWAPSVPADSILIADMSICAPVFHPVPEKGILFYEELAKTGASENGQLYMQAGIDYGPEEFHGKITGLATS